MIEMPDSVVLRDLVHAALSIAVDENGYDYLLTAESGPVAEELFDYDCDVQEFLGGDMSRISELVPHVESWQKERAQ